MHTNCICVKFFPRLFSPDPLHRRFLYTSPKFALAFSFTIQIRRARKKKVGGRSKGRPKKSPRRKRILIFRGNFKLKRVI